MDIPTISLINHSVYLEDAKKAIKIRPILVKEEKLLLASKDSINIETNDSSETKSNVETIVNVVRACILTPNLDITKLTYSDFIHIFIELRKISKGKTVGLILHCNKCKTPQQQIEIGIDEIIKFSPSENKSSIVMLTDNIGVELRPLTLDFYVDLALDEKYIKHKGTDYMNFLTNCEILKHHTVAIIKGEERFENLTDEQLEFFYDNIRKDDFIALKRWYDGNSKFTIQYDWKCSNSGCENSFKRDDILSFFAFV